jgi:diacylglycerol kinase (ATP)
MKPLVVVIANPAASGFRGDEFRLVVRLLSETYEVETQWPETTAENRHVSAIAADRNAFAVIAMGGDGVVHHAAQSLIGTETALGIVSAGTTNVLSRMLGLSQRPKTAASRLSSAVAQPIPIIELKIHQPNNDTIRRHALFAAGIGFDAEVVNVAERDPWRKKAFGAGHYLASTMQALRTYRKTKPFITATARDFEVAGVSALMQIHDPYTYFGRFPLSLGPTPEDGFHLGIIKALPARSILGIAAKAFRSRIGEAKQVEVSHNVSSARFTFGNPTFVQADGELLGEASSVTATYIADGLRVLI